MKNTHSSSKRLESLDALRGFDLFFLVALGPSCTHWHGQPMWSGSMSLCGYSVMSLGKGFLHGI